MLNPSEWSYGREYHDVWRRTDTTDLQAGTIIVAERKPWRLVDIRPRPHINWNPDYLAVWEKHGSPDPEKWPYRPFALILVPELGDNKREHHCEAGGTIRWTVLPEHFSVCRLCGELPPCRHEYNEAVMEHATEKMTEAMAILPGFCHACREPVTRRQGSVRFEGANLIRPDLGDNSAIFHTRRQCWQTAKNYEDRWSSANPKLRRKLYCYGPAVYHLDGTIECDATGLCPGDVSHGSYQHHIPAGGGYRASDCWCVSGGAAVESIANGVTEEKA